MSKLKKIILIVSITAVLFPMKSNAQFIIGDIIKLTVTKVIKAIDLKVQRMQNQTIWLQNAQKAVENELSKLRLSEISGWSADQRQLFSTYYDELWKIKSTIAYYQRIKDVAARQIALVDNYRQAWNLLRQDRHFNAAELQQMTAVYTGILTASERNLDDVMNVVSSGKTQMSDEQRLELINRAADRLDENYSDLTRFNTENQMLSLQRSKSLADTKTTKQLYGLQ
ncbi:conjugal transfer protein TraI [Mucilaginibacter sp. 14171R-50]|uniref:conjugal transfer protein TraI n=1 Tax=Mucilaginibacter sp. 14171R-50 TaxID=2703789 RepID=UPI00138BB4EB|nr:conjugal transfer protein TraI [Mucilaginibacter sp. 14171R-50]QHS55213.1 conjugal transfer protein TraI [Mucilaginibacter sp. 14171R-50]